MTITLNSPDLKVERARTRLRHLLLLTLVPTSVLICVVFLPFAGAFTHAYSLTTPAATILALAVVGAPLTVWMNDSIALSRAKSMEVPADHLAELMAFKSPEVSDALQRIAGFGRRPTLFEATQMESAEREMTRQKTLDTFFASTKNSASEPGLTS